VGVGGEVGLATKSLQSFVLQLPDLGGGAGVWGVCLKAMGNLKEHMAQECCG